MTRPLNQAVGPAIHITDNDVQNTSGILQGRVAGVTIRGFNSFNDKEELPKIEFEKIKVTSAINAY